MAVGVQFPLPPVPVAHSQLVLSKSNIRLLLLVEDYDGLWDRVNRICDQYMPELSESSLRLS